MKRVFLWAMGCMLGLVAQAQHQQLFDDFRREAGSHAALFIGKVETGYPSTIYKSHPYWYTDQFSQGSVTYKGLVYNNLLLRYDAFLGQLVMNVNGVNICAQMPQVESFVMDGIPFVRRSDEFVALLHESPRMELIQQLQCIPTDELMDHTKGVQMFNRKEKYFLILDGVMYPVDKLKSVQKLFPEHKKALKRFAKQYSLDFKVFRQSSLTTIVKYADELLVKPVN